MTAYFAEALTAPEFAGLVQPDLVGVLPVAAIEPHGPHLPLSTDCDIARGHLGRLDEHLAPGRDVLVLPLQTIGHSLEHLPFPGTFTHAAETLLAMWSDIVRPFRVAGGRRLIVVSSHGGNSEIVGLLTTRLRAEFGMLAVTAAWMRFGQPDGVFTPEELAHGIHGGDVETSLMLHYKPEAVRRAGLADFRSAAARWDEGSIWLKLHGKTRPGWLSGDLNPHGVVGNALAATAEKGAASARHALSGFSQLIEEVGAFDFKGLNA